MDPPSIHHKYSLRSDPAFDAPTGPLEARRVRILKLGLLKFYEFQKEYSQIPGMVLKTPERRGDERLS